MARRGSKSRDFGDLTEQFCAITGGTEEAAQQLLEACEGNLQLAIGMHMDRGDEQSGHGSSGEQSTTPAQPQEGDTADFIPEDIRAPIPQRNEQLIDEQAYSVGLTGRRRGTRSVFDGFRDFQAETRQAEERAREGKAVSRNKKRTLEDLFRPPIDIMHKGSFQSAKDAGMACNKWLMVNIQNVQEFSCQVLNRDVWSSPTIRDTVKYNFIFWQVYSDSEDGKRYMQFYKINQWPYVAIIDPQTGEHIVEWTKFDAPTLIELINSFIAERPKPDGSTELPPAKRTKKQSSIVEASEDSQMAAAIQASLRETHSNTVSVSLDQSSDDNNEDEDDDGELETFSDSASDILDAQYPNKSGKTDQSIISIQSDFSQSGSDSDSDSELEPIVTTKGKASVDSRAKVKNGRCKTVYLESSSNDDSSQGNSDSLPVNDVECVSQESQGSSSSWKDYLGNHSDSQTRLVIRYPDGRREPLTIPCSSQLRSVVQYVSEKEIDLKKHELVTNFPRRNLSSMSLDQDLQEAGLHPQETIFVQEKS